MRWNLGDVLDAVGEYLPADQPALIHGDRIISRSQLNRRSNRLARALLSRGLRPSDKVAFYMYNQPEYMELLAACLKARLVHVNLNYRYLAKELNYILDNSDAAVLVYDRRFDDVVRELKRQSNKVKLWVEVAGDSGHGTDLPYEELAEEGDADALDHERSPGDQVFIYTGGTTGWPKGVMWNHDLLMRAQLDSLKPVTGIDPPENLEAYLEHVNLRGKHARQLPAAPLMHATGMAVSLGTMLSGGTVVTLPGSSFDALELLETIDRHKVTSLTIVGDAFARPILRALEENADRLSLSSLQVIVSSGVMWSREIKQGLLQHIPHVTLLDSFGSSESPALAATITTKDDEVQTSTFRVGETCRVFDEDNREILPGSGQAGFVARSGPIPLGYYKDEEKSKRTFRVIDGVRYVFPGDIARVNDDGSLVLLGRQSACINTGGEKVYSEEVEEVLKKHAAIEDAIVIGVADDRWGQIIVAVVATEGTSYVSEQDLKDHVRAHLADFKVPKKIVFSDTVARLPSGKPNYEATRAYVDDVIAT